MVRFWSILAFGVAGCAALLSVSTWPQQSRAATPSPSQVLGELNRETLPQVPGAANPAQEDWIAEILGPAVPKLDSAVLGGMAEGTKLSELTLEQAYKLTLIRARTPGAKLALGPVGLLDPKELDEQADRSGAGDFDRFRREFFSSGFRDPAHFSSPFSSTVRPWTPRESRWRWRRTCADCTKSWSRASRPG